MRKSSSHITLLLLLILAVKPSIAQPANPIPGYDFHPMQHVIFEDNFSQDSIGKFPSKWYVPFGLYANDSSKKYIHIEKEGNGKEMVINNHVQPTLMPKGFSDNYLPDSFTLEYDFFIKHILDEHTVVYFNLSDTDHYLKSSFCISYTGKLWYWDPVKKLNIDDKKYPGFFDYIFWHHYTLYYNNGRLKWYVDQHCLVDIPRCDFIPHYFALHVCGIAKIRNFRLASGIPQYEFERLATEKKLVTHAINFDVAKSTVKPESMEFIQQLALYLTDHPTLKLEIDGHSDNDGTVAANKKLSQARATEVKRQLLLARVNANRLSVKGFGSSKPLKPGNSSEAKSENRRVEFIVIE